jgi:hypothetical protein
VVADAGESGKNYGFHINPEKANRLTLAAGDQLIVLAGD